MPRSCSRQNSVVRTITDSPESQTQWMMITEERHFENDGNQENNLNICKLRHPKSDTAALFLLCRGAGGETILEIVKFSPPFGSWLIGNSVQKDGSIVVTTPMDPVFLVLPYLINAGKAGKFMTLDQIVQDEDYPDCSRLVDLAGLDCLDQVSDVMGADDIVAYRYNADKALAWLRLKTENVVDALKRSEVQVDECIAVSANFVRSKKEQSAGDEAYLKYACGLISDYLPLDLAASLQDYLGIKEDVKQDQNEEPPNKKAKLNNHDITPLEDYSSNGKNLKKENSKGKQTAAQKKLDKIDKTGMKTIASFFSPKS